MNRKFPIA